MTTSHLQPESDPKFGQHRAHLIGISGAGMKSLAEVLTDRGWRVSGSDFNPDSRVQEKLSALGVKVFAGHDAQHVHAKHDVVIYSPAIPNDNIERTTAAALKIPQLSYVDALAELMLDRCGIAIAGTHGKSTTTAMLGHILKVTGHEPTVLCGAERVEDHRSGFAGSGPHVVVEACEYRGHFLKLAPKLVCLNSIEPDHFDCFPNYEDAIALYQLLLDELPEAATVVTNLECETSCSLKRPAHINEITTSISNHNATWCANHLRIVNGHQQCDIFYQNKHLFELTLPQPGEHNVRNALCAMAIALQLGVELTDLKPAIESFQGLARRYQKIPNRLNATLIDDYAHHPTEVATTLTTARKMNPGERIICVFQPHQVSRTKELFIEFVNALALADQVFVLPVFGAREQCETELIPMSQALVSGLQRLNVCAQLIPALDQVWRTLETAVLPDDLIFTLGAGDIARLHHERI